MQNILVLFDIDGTLVRGTRRVNPRSPSLEYAFKKVYGITDFTFNNYPQSDGTTDYNIVIDAGERNGLRENELKKKYKLFIDRCIEYLDNLENYEKNILPGVSKLLEILDENHVVCGLLTGNAKKKAIWKIKKVGLHKYFKFGGYGDFIKNRSDLLPVALREAEKATKLNFERNKIFVVGDTCNDVKVAIENKVKSIAVATGRFNIDDLKKCKPDFIFSDLTDDKKFLKIIGL